MPVADAHTGQGANTRPLASHPAAQPGAAMPSLQPLLQRGLHVPFTGALLCGARVRQGTHPRLGFLLPTTDGTRGYQVVPWASLRETHMPTLHDLRLTQYLDRLPELSVGTIRAAAGCVGSEGFAGEAVAVQARKHAILERNRIVRRVALLRRLAMQSGDAAWAASPCHAPPGSPDGIAWEAMGAHRIAGLRGLPREMVARAIDDLSRSLPTLGGAAGTSAWPVRVISLLRACQRDWAEQAARHAAARSDEREAGELSRRRTAFERLAAAAGQSMTAATRQLALVEAASEDVALLVDLWRNDSTGPATLVAPLELLLDGWLRICLLWRDAQAQKPENPAQIGVELALLASLIPAATDLTATAPGGAVSGEWFAPALRAGGRALTVEMPDDETLAALVLRNERVRLAEIQMEMTDEAVAPDLRRERAS